MKAYLTWKPCVDSIYDEDFSGFKHSPPLFSLMQFLVDCGSVDKLGVGFSSGLFQCKLGKHNVCGTHCKGYQYVSRRWNLGFTFRKIVGEYSSNLYSDAAKEPIKYKRKFTTQLQKISPSFTKPIMQVAHNTESGSSSFALKYKCHHSRYTVQIDQVSSSSVIFKWLNIVVKDLVLDCNVYVSLSMKLHLYNCLHFTRHIFIEFFVFSQSDKIECFIGILL